MKLGIVSIIRCELVSCQNCPAPNGKSDTSRSRRFGMELEHAPCVHSPVPPAPPGDPKGHFQDNGPGNSFYLKVQCKILTLDLWRKFVLFYHSRCCLSVLWSPGDPSGPSVIVE